MNPEAEDESTIQIEGSIIRTDDLTQEKIHQYAVMTALKRGNRRFCAHCQKFKPERTHHCRQCGDCVLKMDHHCPWVNNCVGFRNYKFFLNMLFWAGKENNFSLSHMLKSLVICLLFLSITFTEVIQDTVFNPTVNNSFIFFLPAFYLNNFKVDSLTLYFYMVEYILGIVLAAVLIIFLSFHFW